MCLIQQVLFPLLTKLLENISPADVGGMEETRMRASTLLSKVSTPLLPESLGETMFLNKTKLLCSILSISDLDSCQDASLTVFSAGLLHQLLLLLGHAFFSELSP